METDIGQPFQYQPAPSKEDDDSTPIADMSMEEEYRPPPQMMWQYAPPSPPPMMRHEPTKVDLGSIDKNTLIIAFAVFLLGFFMGKTMQPVILRSH